MDIETSGTIEMQCEDGRLFTAAQRAMPVATLTYDIGPQLQEWYENPEEFTERVLVKRRLKPHERRVVRAVAMACKTVGADFQHALGIMEMLKPMASGIIRALGLNTRNGFRRGRKLGHLDTMRAWRADPERFPDPRYEHRWIPTRCGACGTRYATETFLNFRNAYDGRRMYAMEGEWLLECGHPNTYSYPVQWERDGRPVPRLTQAS